MEDSPKERTATWQVPHGRENSTALCFGIDIIKLAKIGCTWNAEKRRESIPEKGPLSSCRNNEDIWGEACSVSYTHVAFRLKVGPEQILPLLDLRRTNWKTRENNEF